VGVGINPLLQYLLPPEARELVEETRDYRQKNFTDLSLEQQLKILKLNRHLFEALYPQLCPKAALKSQTEGYMMIAFSSTHRFYLLKDSKIVVEQQVKKSALNSQRFGFLAGTSDDEIQVSFPIPFAGSSFPGPRSAKYDKRMPWGKYYLCDKGENHFAVSYPNLEDAQRCRVGKEDYQKVYLALKRKACPPKKTRAGGYIEGHALLSGSFRRVRELLADYAYKQYLEQGNSPLGGSALKALQRRLKGDVRQEYFKRDNPNLHVAVSRDWTWGCLAFEFSALDYLLAIVPKGTPLVIYGTAKYFAEEFQGDLSISTLCTEINKTGYGLLLSTPDNSVERLNEILTQLTYKKWLTIAGHKQLTDQIKDDDLKKELRKYVRLTSKYEEQPFSKLTRTQRQNRMILARMLLEFTYPGLSPKRYDFWG